jgi:hypothetical protein
MFNGKPSSALPTPIPWRAETREGGSTPLKRSKKVKKLLTPPCEFGILTLHTVTTN